jgi:hypothetical protein
MELSLDVPLGLATESPENARKNCEMVGSGAIPAVDSAYSRSANEWPSYQPA